MNFSDKRKAWKDAAKLENWVPYTKEQFIDGIHSTNEEDWKPGGYGTQAEERYSGSLTRFIPQLIPVLGFQPIVDHFHRELPWLRLGLWNVYPNQYDAKPFIEKLYQKRIDGLNTGWMKDE